VPRAVNDKVTDALDRNHEEHSLYAANLLKKLMRWTDTLPQGLFPGEMSTHKSHG
jgi:hypothetical protein